MRQGRRCQPRRIWRRSYTGTFDVNFALRYEASELSIRTHQFKPQDLALPDRMGLHPGRGFVANQQP